MDRYPARNLFQFQIELIDTKVDMAVNNTIDKVVDQIRGLRSELREEMHNGFSSLNVRISAIENRLVSVETRLGMVSEKQKEIRSKFVDYFFKAGWVLLSIFGGILSFIISQHILIK